MKAKLSKFKQSKFYYIVHGISVGITILVSNLYLQWCQNNLSVALTFKFAFSWHTEKFLLGYFVLSVVFLFFWSLAGSWWIGLAIYSVGIGILGFADYQKMLYREEPIYPEDLKMITEFGLLKEMIGWLPFLVILAIVLVGVYFLGKAIYRSLFFTWKQQVFRLMGFVSSFLLPAYISHFNDSNNLLRQAYDRTALWVPLVRR